MVCLVWYVLFVIVSHKWRGGQNRLQYV